MRRRLLADPALRSRMARARILYGRLDRTFPDRSQHGLGGATPLHRPHRSVHLPSASTLRRIARRHGVGGLRIFGSAVRSDFRPDSDIDILLRFRDGVHPTLRSLLELEGALETVFARDVDLVREELVGADDRERIEGEAVALL
ncbi:MAG: nucleotidyltransferase family protein [Candidatus Limnocylindria bacterium]